MPCIYNGFDGKCGMRGEDDTSECKTSEYGWDKDGVCVVDEDPKPSTSCIYYETPEDNLEDEEESPKGK